MFSTDFRKTLNVKFHENLSSGKYVVACGRTDAQTDGKTTDMTKQTVAFRNFAYAAKTKLIKEKQTKKLYAFMEPQIRHVFTRDLYWIPS
jgi:hypothetical protein